jgi:Ca2+-binding RTX toxin-like protein
MDNDGDFVVTWSSYGQNGSIFGVYAQRYDAAGAAVGGEFKVNTYTSLSQSSPAVAMDADGDFVVTWQSHYQDGSSWGVYAQRYDATGAAVGGEFQVNSHTANNQYSPAFAMDNDGDFVVTWQSDGQDGSSYGVYAQRYDAAGAAVGGEFRVNTYTASGQSSPAVAMDNDGDFVVTWSSYGQDGSSWGVYAQRYQPENSVRFDGTALSIRGTHLADNIMVSETSFSLSVSFNGVTFDFDTSLVTQIFIHGIGGDDQLTLANSVTKPARLYGDEGNDTLTGAAGDDSLDGGDGNDIYVFNTNTPLGSDSVTDSAGTDRLSFVGSTSSITVDLGTTAAQAVNANLTLTLASASALENLNGGSGDDMLTGNALNNVLDGGAGNDSLFGADGADTLYGRAGNDTLDGGNGNDGYLFNTSTALGSDTVIDSEGIDRLSFVGSTNNVIANLDSTVVQPINANLTLTLPSASAIENIYGGSGNDTLTGNALGNVLDGGAGNDSLTGGEGNDALYGQAGDDTLDGGNGNDTYAFNTNTVLGTDTITDIAGIDRLTFVGSTNDVSVDLGSTATQTVNANLSLSLTSASSLENLYGGFGNDTLTGNALANWLLGGAGNDSLNGGNGNDTYACNTNTALGSDTITEIGGIDTLTFAGSTSDVIVSLGSTAVQSVNANLTLTLDSASSMENLSGGSGNDTLTGNSLANRFIGGPGNDVMTGAAGNDWYNFDADSYLGSDSIDESGGGIDTLNFSETTSYPVSVDLSYSGEQEVVFYYLLLQLTLMAGDTMENVIGGAGNDMLIGNTLNNTLTGGGGDDVLVGGAGNDTFAFDTDVNLGIDTVNESGGGVDTLDFRNTTTQNIIVDLFVTSAQVVNSNLALKLSSQYDFENVSGGALNDILIGNSRANTLTGNGGNDVLSSRAGNDILQGGAGRNILLGGFGADTLTGGADEDLLLGARFLLEEDAIALAALRNEWISASSFDDRVAHLLGTLEGGVDDGFTLTPSTVKEDSSRDTLNGGNGRDWYLRNHLSATTLWRDVINDPNLDSVFTDIDTWL